MSESLLIAIHKQMCPKYEALKEVCDRVAYDHDYYYIEGNIDTTKTPYVGKQITVLQPALIMEKSLFFISTQTEELTLDTEDIAMLIKGNDVAADYASIVKQFYPEFGNRRVRVKKKTYGQAYR